MRDIKFRVWDKKTKKIREVSSISFHNKRESFDFDKSNLPKVVNCWGFDIIQQKDIILHREIDEVIIEQYTGTKDKNEVEVYGGDFIEIHFTFGTYRFKIEYLEELFQFVAINIDCYEDIYSLESLSEMDFEVIGNIHESVN